MLNIEKDRKLIEKLGGPAKLARLLGYSEPGGTNRVCNWLTRGIPPRVKIEHQDIFLKQNNS